MPQVRWRRRCRATPNMWPSTTARAIATANPLSVANSGVVVSPRAKKAGDSALTSTWAGRPSASNASACAVTAVSLSGKRAVLEQRPHDRFAQHDQSERCGQSQANREFERAGFCRAGEACRRRDGTGQFRHQHGAHGDADDAERQLDQAVGEIQPRHRRGDDDAMIAPAMISNCGPELATMPAIPLRKKPRIGASNDTLAVQRVSRRLRAA